MPSIAMSGYADRTYASTCRNAGFCEYMVKPVDMDALMQTVARLLR